MIVCGCVCVSMCVSVCGRREGPSSTQVIKPVNLESLVEWADHVPADVRRDIRKIAPMLSRLGYDPDAYPPPYGKADAFVANNTLLVEQNAEYWQRKADELLLQTKVESTPSAD